mgnify:FL=1
MKRLLHILSAVMCLAACSQKPHRGTIDAPLYEVRNTKTVEISRIDLTDSTTVLHVEARFTPHWWIKIVSSTFLADEKGNQYPIVSAEGIELDKEFWMPDSGEAQFTLTFPPIPAGVNSIDFIEGYEQGAFRIWGIRLDGKLPKVNMPKPEKLAADATLPDIHPEYGKATFKVKVLGYRPDDQMNTVYLETCNLLSESGFKDGRLSDDGTFQIEVPLVQTSSANFYLAGLGELMTVFLEPGETTECFVNLRESSRRNSLFKESRDEEPLVVFKGAHAALNQAFADADMNHVLEHAATMGVDDITQSEIAGYDMKQYIDKMIELSQARMKVYYESDLPSAVKDYYLLNENANLLSGMMDSSSELAYAQTLAQNKSNEEYIRLLIAYQPERNRLVPADMVDVMNLPWAVYTSGYHRVKEIFMHQKSEDVFNAYPFLRTEGSFLEVADACLLMKGIREFKPLDEELMAKVQQLPDAWREYIEGENADLIATIEKNRKIEGYRKNEAGEIADEDLFASIIAPFRGKTILVDFWETWCGPCRNANEMMAPLKEELKDKDIVYIYIASESSPVGTWENMIPDLKGEHYRLSDKQSTYLKNMFGVEGVPTYLIVDPEGTVCWKQTGFPGAERMKAELFKAMGE